MKRGLLWLAGGIAVFSAAAQEPWAKDQRLPSFRDRLGYSWPLTAAGSFYSTGGNVFDSANQLSIAGERFVAERIERREDRFVFIGRCGAGWAVRREIWIDVERAAAFCLEEIHNESGQAGEVDLEVSTHFRTPWRTWSARDGKVLIPGVPQATTGAFLSFPPRDGDSDLFLLFGEGAKLEAQEQTFTARFPVSLAHEAGLRLLHFMGQRRADPGKTLGLEVFSPFFREGRLVAPGVTGTLANFPGLDPAPAGVVWILRDGTERSVAGPVDQVIELTGALGRMRVNLKDIVRFDGRIWESREGWRIHAVAVPGQVPVDDLAAIRGTGTWSPAASGLRLKNGDVWPGRETGRTGLFVRWEIDGQVRDVPREWVQGEKGDTQ